jgi:hypothetical protein
MPEINGHISDAIISFASHSHFIRAAGDHLAVMQRQRIARDATPGGWARAPRTLAARAARHPLQVIEKPLREMRKALLEMEVAM